MNPKPIAADHIKGLYTFLESFDWTESWLYYLVAFHVFLVLLIIGTRRWTLVQVTIFLFLLITVYEAEPLNEYFAKNHRIFTHHQYFDSSGLFISVVMSFPFLLCAALIVANWFYVSTQLMRQLRIVKTEQKSKMK